MAHCIGDSIADLLDRLTGRKGRSLAAIERAAIRLAHPADTEVLLAVDPLAAAGLRAASEQLATTIALLPSDQLRTSYHEQCTDLRGADRIRFVLGSAQRTGLDSESVDIVLVTQGTRHWPDRAATIAELHRVLRPGGRMLISLPDDEPVTRFALADELTAGGFVDTQTWLWQPQGAGNQAVPQLWARRA